MSECHGIRCVRQTETGHLTEILIESQVTVLLSWYPVFLQVAASEFFWDLFTYFPSKVFIWVHTRSCLCRFSYVENFPEVPGMRCYSMFSNAGYSIFSVYIVYSDSHFNMILRRKLNVCLIHYLIKISAWYP